MSFLPKALVVVVTGANSGVGFGICERLLLQLSGGLPPLAAFTSNEIDAVAEDFTEADSLILILACRNQKRAQDAKSRLLSRLDSDIQGRQNDVLFQRGTVFRASLVVETADLDLCKVASVFSFCEKLASAHAYITHIFLNAGTGDFSGINWPLCIYQILTQPITAVTYPSYKLEHKGSMSEDGLGLVWQSNVFGHYMMVRLLTPLLERSQFRNSRIVWTSSLEADTKAAVYEPDDLQLTNTIHPYEASKFQQELLSIELDRQFGQDEPIRDIRSIVFEPGVLATSIIIAHLGWFLDKIMVAAFYLARWCGSPAHVVSTYKSAVTAVNIALLSADVLPKTGEPTRLSSRVNRRGKEYTDKSHVHWDPEKAADLVAYCEQIFQSVLVEHSGVDPSSNNGTLNQAHSNGQAH